MSFECIKYIFLFFIKKPSGIILMHRVWNLSEVAYIDWLRTKVIKGPGLSNSFNFSVKKMKYRFKVSGGVVNVEIWFVRQDLSHLGPYSGDFTWVASGEVDARVKEKDLI